MCLSWMNKMPDQIPEKIKITSEDQVYQLLDSLIEKKISIDGKTIEFSGWPTLTMHLQGADFDSTITPSLMKAFLELQSGLYRSYSIARYNSPKITTLSKEEKEALEIKVKVQPGSSIFSIDMQQLLEKLCHDLVGKMDPTSIVILVLGSGLIWAGQSVFKKYLDDRAQTRQAEVKSEEQRALIEHLKFSQEQETERAKVMASLIQENPRLHTISNYAEEAKAELIKRSASADTLELLGTELDTEIATELVKNARSKSEDIRLDGMYRILNVDSSNPEEFKVKLKSLESGDEFNAKVQDRTLERRHLEALQRGEWSRTAVKVQINAKLLNEEIKNAIVIKAEFPIEK